MLGVAKKSKGNNLDSGQRKISKLERMIRFFDYKAQSLSF